jgi:hypothetical protein
MQPLEIAVIKKPANHVRWDLARALPVKLVPGDRDQPQPTQPRDERGKAAGFDLDLA